MNGDGRVSSVHPTEIPGDARNLPCPCGSGAKAKRCPGLWQARADAVGLRLAYIGALRDGVERELRERSPLGFAAAAAVRVP